MRRGYLTRNSDTAECAVVCTQCVSTPGSGRIFPHCRCRACAAETGKHLPVNAIQPFQQRLAEPEDSPAAECRGHADDVAAASSPHQCAQQPQHQPETTEIGWDFKSDDYTQCRQDIRSMTSSDDGPKCGAW